MSNIKLFPTRALSAITQDFLRGSGSISHLDDILFPLAEDPQLKSFAERVTLDMELLQLLNDEALRREFDDDNALDAWLAPRLHMALRIPRRLAADPRFWTWLAVTVFRQYVHRRWADNKTGAVLLYRYVDTNMNLRNGVSRLWWGAEMTRNGPDYTPVRQVFSRVRTAQFALELAYSSFKPAAIAFARVCVESRPELNDDEKRKLSTTLRAYLSTTSLEALGGDGYDVEKVDSTWYDHRSSLESLLGSDNDLEGPEDGFVSEEAVAAVSSWMRKLVEEIRRATAA
jgi:hypothetical protein